MKAIALIAGLVLCTAASQQGLSTEDISMAIEQGRAGKTLQKKCSASGDNGFDIIVEGPTGRIMRAAADAKRDKRDFVPADVTTSMARPVVSVTTKRDSTLSASRSAVQMPGVPGVFVAPETTPDYLRPAPSLDNAYRVDMVIRSKAQSNVPVLRVSEPIVSVRSAATRDPGQKPVALSRPFPGNDLIAKFDLAEFRALPPGAVEVVVLMTDTGERKCAISEKDRAKIR